MKQPTKFIAMWDNTGLEHIIDVSKHEKEIDAWEKRKIWNTLKDNNLIEPKPRTPLQMMIIRARANSQRHYEIYGFTSTVNEKVVRSMFKDDPQIIVNWIRKNGHKIYSDAISKKEVVIV
jgi:hypothetical protein